MLGRERVEAVLVGIGMQPCRGPGILQDNDPVGDTGTGTSDLDETHPAGGEQRQNMLRDKVAGRPPLVTSLARILLLHCHVGGSRSACPRCWLPRSLRRDGGVAYVEDGFVIG